MVIAERAAQLLPEHVRSRLAFLQLTPFDDSTEEGRGRERYRRAALTTTVTLAARVTSLGAALITVPLTLGYLGAERYGMWMTMSSLIALLSFTDLGIGLGVLNAIAAAAGRREWAQARRYVASALAMLAVVALALLGLLALAYQFVPWPRVFNVVSPLAQEEAGPAIAVFLACFALAMPLGAVTQARAGLQEGYANGLFAMAGSLAGLASVVMAIQLRLGLPFLVLALAGIPMLASLANAASFFGRQHPEMRPSRGAVSASAAGHVLRTGSLFLFLQLAVTVAYTSDNVVLAQLIGPEAVTVYSIATKLFLIPTLVVTLALTPLWPAYRESIARGDVKWVEQTLRRSLAVTLAITLVPSIVLVFAGQWLIRLWVGPGLEVPMFLLVGIAAWTIIGGIGNCLAMLFNGAQVFRFQVIVGGAMAIANLALSIVLTRSIGVAGVIWGTVLAYSMVSLIPSTAYVPRLLGRLALRGAG